MADDHEAMWITTSGRPPKSRSLYQRFVPIAGKSKLDGVGRDSPTVWARRGMVDIEIANVAQSKHNSQPIKDDGWLLRILLMGNKRRADGGGQLMAPQSTPNFATFETGSPTIAFCSSPYQLQRGPPVFAH